MAVNRVSRKRQAANRERAKLRSELINSRSPKCERCRVNDWTDMHERLSRARLGSITDRNNIALLCRGCHTWVTTHPKLATAEGWLIARWPREDK